MNEIILNLFDATAYGYPSGEGLRLTAYKRTDGQTDVSRYLSVSVSWDELPSLIDDVDDDWYTHDSGWGPDILNPYNELLALWLSKLLDVTKAEE